MNILIVSYRAEISGGSNRSLLSIIDLLKDNHNITLILPKKTGKMYEEAKKRNVNIKYMHYSRVGKKRTKNKLKNFAEIFVMRLKLIHDYLYTILNYSYLRKQKIDIVYSNGAQINAGRFISKMLGVPHVWHIREYIDLNQLYPKNIYKIMEKDADKFILISSEMYNDFKEHMSEDKLVMISNGIKYVECPKKIEHDGFNILLTGRITPLKNQIDAVKAINIIVNQYKVDKKIKLLFAGSCADTDIDYKNMIDKYIEENNLQDYIEFLGEINNLTEIRQKMDIELMCSKREPFGRVTVEAMRSYLPVVGANSGGTKDIIIDGQNGLLYEPEDIEELAEKIMIFITDKELLNRLSNNAKKFSENNFTEEQLYNTIHLLEEVYKNRRKK